MMHFDQLAAKKQFRTDNVFGHGQIARVSRCGPVPIVRLYATMEEAEIVASRGKVCMSFGCQQNHSTERVQQLTEEQREKYLPELGEFERARA